MFQLHIKLIRLGTFLILILALWQGSSASGKGEAPLRAAAAPPRDTAPIRGPFVDPPEAYPHAPVEFQGDLRSQLDQPAQRDSSQVLQPLRLTPGETRKSYAPQLADWVDAAAQTANGAGAMPDPLPGFAGLNFGIDGAGWPPDTVGDVSEDFYIQMVNISIGIFDLSTGSLLYRAPLNTFFPGPTDTPCDNHHRGDPVVLFDPYVRRWLVADFAWFDDQPGFYQCLAVSQGANPLTSGWYFYALRADTGSFEYYLNDYPKLSAWHNGWYMTANMFQMSYPGNGFGVRVWALDRLAMVNGQPLREVHFDLCTLGDCASLLPAHDNLAQAPVWIQPPNYLLSASPPDHLSLWKLAVDFNNLLNSTLSGPVTIPVAPFATAASIPQRDTFQVLDSLSSRLMMQLQYRYLDGSETLWANHTVASSGVAGVRWYELRNPNSLAPLLAQQSTYQPDASHRWMGSLAVDRDGNLALGYSISSSEMYPSIRVAGRMAPETPDQLPQAEVEVITGLGAQDYIYRWGDYSAMTVAPDGCMFYYTNEYFLTTGTNWQTWITPLRYPSCGQPKGTLQGVVRDAVTDQTLADIPVIAASDTVTLTVQTGADGAFVLSLMEGVYTVSAGPRLPEYPLPAQAAGIAITAGQTTGLELRLDPYPALTVASIGLQDAAPGGNGNQVPEPGESNIDLQVGLLNSGSIAATQIRSQLSSLTPGVSLASSRSNYPDIQPGQTQTQTRPYSFTIDPTLSCGTKLQFRQEITDNFLTYGFDLAFNAAQSGERQALFTNDVESGTLLWQTAGVNNTWDILTASNLPSPIHAWTDSPAGNYHNNADASLTTTTYNLTGKRGVQVQFIIKYALEAGWDYLYLESSLDGGETWSPEPLISFSGYQIAWKPVVVDAPELDGQPAVKLRFRLLSDAYITFDGAVLDDIALTFEPYRCVFPVKLPPATPVPLAPMGGELFVPGIRHAVTFRWLPGASGAAVEGFRLFVDGSQVADLPGDQTSLSLPPMPGAHSWTVEAYNSWGASPQAALTFFWHPFYYLFPFITNP